DRRAASDPYRLWHPSASWVFWRRNGNPTGAFQSSFRTSMIHFRDLVVPDQMTHSNQISMLGPLFVGTMTTFSTIIVHALILGIIVTQVRRDLERGRVG